MPSPLPGNPTIAPTESQVPTLAPSKSPIGDFEPLPTAGQDSSEEEEEPVQQFLTQENVEMRLTGVSELGAASAAIWGTLTGNYIREEILEINGPNNVENLKVNLSLVSQAEIDSNGRLLGVKEDNEDYYYYNDFDFDTNQNQRSLSTVLVIVYDVNVALVSMIQTHDLERYVEGPFNTQAEQDQFIRDLKATNDPAFAQVSAVSVTLPNDLGTGGNNIDGIKGDGGGGGGGGSMGLVIGIAMVGTMIVALIGILIHRRLRNNGSFKKSSSGGTPMSPGHTDPSNMMMNRHDMKYAQEINVGPNDDISTLGEPIGLFGDHITTTDETATIDYDYKRLLKESQSVAGESTNLNSILGEMTEVTSGVYIDKLVEDRIDVDAPPGNLGLIIDAGDDGCPFVCEVKETSVLRDRVWVGDRLLSVDSVDLTIMRTGDVYKVIASKKDFPQRKFVFARPRQSGGSKSTDSQGWNV